MKVEFVLGGLSIGGEIRSKGDMVDIPDDSPSTPQEQADRWGNKVFYVEVGSEYDTNEMKKIFRAQGSDMLERMKVEVEAQMSPQGKSIMGIDEDEPSALEKAEQKMAAKKLTDEVVDKQQFKKPEDTGASVANEDLDESEVEDAEEKNDDLPNRSKVYKMKRAELESLAEEHGIDSKGSVKVIKKRIIEELEL